MRLLWKQIQGKKRRFNDGVDGENRTSAVRESGLMVAVVATSHVGRVATLVCFLDEVLSVLGQQIFLSVPLEGLESKKR